MTAQPGGGTAGDFMIGGRLLTAGGEQSSPDLDAGQPQ
jgi:hypothetical protein